MNRVLLSVCFGLFLLAPLASRGEDRLGNGILSSQTQGAAAAGEMGPSKGEGCLKALRSLSADERLQAAQAVRLQRTAAIHELYSIVRGCARDPERARVAAGAMELLGELRASETAGILAENLAFTLPPGAPRAGEPFHNRPQIKALIEIGLPSLDPTLKAVTETDDTVVLKRAAIVVDQVLGSDFAVLFLKDRQEREKDAVKRQRLKRLEQQIDTVERNRTPKWNTGPLRPWPSAPAGEHRREPSGTETPQR